MEWKKNIKIGLFVFLLGLGTYGIYFLYRVDKPEIIKSFPDPFLFNNGTSVETEEDWSVRREEIKEILFDEEYGHMPERPDAIEVKIDNSEEKDDGSTKQELTLTIIPFNSTPEENIEVSVWVYIPDGEGPFPTIVKVSPDGTGSQTEMNEKILERDFMYVCYEHTDLDPDTKGYDEDGPAQEIYGDDYDWGSLAVWAWGAMRVADYLLGEPWVSSPDGIPDVDPDALIITGHSRRGKTALLTGAMDERFTMVVPNGSGCGGSGSFLIQGYLCETIADITSKNTFRSWFHEEFKKYGNNEEELEFDQHFLLALVAPRVLLSTNAFQDYWANPSGTQATHEAVAPVFEFLDAKKHNALHYRPGIHSFTEEDFTVIMDLAQKELLGKDISGNFYMKPYNIEIPMDYKAPE